MNRLPSDQTLNNLADAVADEFEAHRHSNSFNEHSVVIDNSDRERSTLIVHIDRKQAADLAERVEAFLRDHGAYQARTPHSSTSNHDQSAIGACQYHRGPSRPSASPVGGSHPALDPTVRTQMKFLATW